MTPAELIDIIRSEYLDEFLDEASSGAVAEAAVRNKTNFLCREIGTGQRRACWRGDLRRIFDDTTAEICDIPLVAGQRSYALDGRILLIDTIVYELHDYPLEHRTRAWLDSRRRDWRLWEEGEPYYFFIQGRTLYLDREPSGAETGKKLKLNVWREPLRSPRLKDQLEVDLDPEAIASWVSYRAFMRPNQDQMRRGLAQHHLQMFNSYYGEEVSKPARDEMLAAPPYASFEPQHPMMFSGARKRRSNFEYDYQYGGYHR